MSIGNLHRLKTKGISARRLSNPRCIQFPQVAVRHQIEQGAGNH